MVALCRDTKKRKEGLLQANGIGAQTVSLLLTDGTHGHLEAGYKRLEYIYVMTNEI
jgi:hypothetical protein